MGYAVAINMELILYDNNSAVCRVFLGTFVGR